MRGDEKKNSLPPLIVIFCSIVVITIHIAYKSVSLKTIVKEVQPPPQKKKNMQTYEGTDAWCVLPFCLPLLADLYQENQPNAPFWQRWKSKPQMGGCFFTATLYQNKTTSPKKNTHTPGQDRSQAFPPPPKKKKTTPDPEANPPGSWWRPARWSVTTRSSLGLCSDEVALKSPTKKLYFWKVLQDVLSLLACFWPIAKNQLRWRTVTKIWIIHTVYILKQKNKNMAYIYFCFFFFFRLSCKHFADGCAKRSLLRLRAILVPSAPGPLRAAIKSFSQKPGVSNRIWSENIANYSTKYNIKIKNIVLERCCWQTSLACLLKHWLWWLFSL